MNNEESIPKDFCFGSVGGKKYSINENILQKSITLGNKAMIARVNGGLNDQLNNTLNISKVVIDVFILPKNVGAILNEAY